MSRELFKEGTTGRDIIDEVVLSNQSRNQEVFDSIKDLPIYFGQTNIGGHKVELTPIKGRSKIGTKPLIIDIIEGMANCNLNPGDGNIKVVRDGSIVKVIKCNPVLIKLIKTCVACSFNINDDFSITVTAFVNKLIEGLNSTLSLPLQLPEDNPTQKIVGKELNDFLKNICDEYSISYSEIVNVKKSRKNESLIDKAKMSAGVKNNK